MGLQSALVVDDSRSARFALRSLLEHQQIRVDTVATAQQAMTYLQTHRPDVVFMDDLMPGMDGLEAIDQLASDPHTSRIPIVMYTGREDEVSLRQAWRRGVVGILSKPFAPADVNRLLAQLGHDLDSTAATPPPQVPRLVREVVASGNEAPMASFALPEADVGTDRAAGVTDDLTETAATLTLEAVAEPAPQAVELTPQWILSEADAAPAGAPQTDLHHLQWSDAELEALRSQLVQTIKEESRLAVAQLVGELLEQQVGSQIRQREEQWRRSQDGLRSDQERFQVQMLEERIPRLLNLMEHRFAQQLTNLQTSLDARLDHTNLTPLQRTLVAHVARTEAAEAAQRPARQSARRVAAEFVRNDLNALNQNFERLRQRFNWLVLGSLVSLTAIGTLAYLWVRF